jgi:GT2 family glycosyltransferase
MNVSIVICAYTMDRWDDLSTAVQSCANQSLKPHEVIIVIDHNDELFARADAGLAGARVVSNLSTKGLSGARNTGVAISSGDVIVFLDDDAFAEMEWLENLTAPFSDESVAGVGGWVKPNWPSETPQWFPETFLWVLGCSYMGLPESDSMIRNPIGANMAMRRRVFTSVGGFTSGLGRIGRIPLGCEETELCIRYSAHSPGDRFVLRREAIVHHRVPISRLRWDYFWKRCWAEGLSKAAVSHLVGRESGLASERQHVVSAVPRELVSCVAIARRDPRAAAGRVGLILGGSVLAVVGFIRGALSSHDGLTKAGRSDFAIQSPESWSESRDGGFGIRRTGCPDGPNDLTDTGKDTGNEWEWRPDPSPVKLVQANIDELEEAQPLDVLPGSRLWVEVVSTGRVLGVVERRAEADGISTETLSELAQEFAASMPSGEREVSDEALPFATVIVPTILQRNEMISTTIASLLAVDYPSFEIILVDNRPGTVQGPLPELPPDPRLRIEWEPVPGISAARNHGIAASTGEFVAFTDDDAVVDRNWLRALGRRFVTDPTIDAIGGMVRPREIDTRPQLWFEEFFGGFSKSFDSAVWSLADAGGDDPLFPYAPGKFAAGCNMAFRRTSLERVGLFDTRLGTGTPSKGGEDLAMFVQIILAGGTVAYEPTALVRHSHRRSEQEFQKQVFGYGAGLTAMYTSLVVRDPRQIIPILRRVPAGLHYLLARPPDALVAQPSYPKGTLVRQILGMAYGPIAYGRSMIGDRRPV